MSPTRCPPARAPRFTNAHSTGSRRACRGQQRSAHLLIQKRARLPAAPEEPLRTALALSQVRPDLPAQSTMRFESSTTKTQPWVWAATAAYAVIVSVLSWHHELWRDEVRALNIAANSHSPQDLFHLLKNEGHPALWHVLLFVGNHITGSMRVLKPISVTIAVGAVFVLLRFGRFPAWQKLLIIAGQLPLYEYAVMCRNYGISMLLIFAAASLYRYRFSRPLRFAAILALLANTNVHSTLVAVAWLVAWLAEWMPRPRSPEVSASRMAVGVGIVAIGVATCVWVVYPDSTSIVANTQSHTPAGIWRALIQALDSPGDIHTSTVGLSQALAVNVLFWLFVASFLARPWLSLAVALVGIGLATFPRLIYPLGLRHSGILVMFCVAAIWMAADAPATSIRFAPLDRVVKVLERHRSAAFSIFLLMQVTLGVPTIDFDLHHTLSGAAALGHRLKTDPALSAAIIIPEPEPQIEALPYYCDNPIYLTREGHYMVKISFTSANAQENTLDEILSKGEELRRTTGRPIVFALGHGLDENGPYERTTAYGKVFRYSREGLTKFRSMTTALGFVGADSGDENFSLYQLN